MYNLCPISTEKSFFSLIPIGNHTYCTQPDFLCPDHKLNSNVEQAPRNVERFRGVPDRVVSAIARKSARRTLVAVRNHARKLAYRAVRSATKARPRRHDDERDLRSSSGQICNTIHVRAHTVPHTFTERHAHSGEGRVAASTKGPQQYSFKTESNERASRPAQEGQRGSKSESRRVTVGDPAAGCRQHSYNNTTRPREPTHRVQYTRHTTDASFILYLVSF